MAWTDWLTLAKDVYTTKQAMDEQKAERALREQEAQARMASAAAAGAGNAQAQQMADALAAQARSAYSSLTQTQNRSPAAIAPSSGSPLDAFLPYIVLGLAALGVFAVLRK